MMEEKKAQIVAHCEGDTVIIESPYYKDEGSFNNADAYPDLHLQLLPTGRVFLLHKITLAKASLFFMDAIKACCGGSLGWSFAGKRKVDEQALEKVLHFCYGAPLCVGTKGDDCCAVITVLYQMELTCCTEVVNKIRMLAVEKARKDLSTGMELLRSCTRYVKCSSSTHCELNKDLASVVFSRENICNHYQEVVDGCLMRLPMDYLNMVEYGDPHTIYSELSLKMKYLRKNPMSLSEEDKQSLLCTCDMTQLNAQELKELEKTHIADE